MLPERDADGSAPMSSLVLLDDPLSAVDTVVGRALFDGCIGHGRGAAPTGTQAAPFLQSRGAICTRVLVTHQLQYVSAADRIVVVGADGTMVAQVCCYLPLHFKRILLTILTCPPHILTFKNSP